MGEENDELDVTDSFAFFFFRSNDKGVRMGGSMSKDSWGGKNGREGFEWLLFELDTKSWASSEGII